MVNYSRSPRKLLLGTIMTLVCRQACTGNKHSKSGPQTNLPSRSNSADPTTLLQEQVQGKLQIGHTALHVKHSVRNSVNSGAAVDFRFHVFALRSALIPVYYVSRFREQRPAASDLCIYGVGSADPRSLLQLRARCWPANIRQI